MTDGPKHPFGSWSRGLGLVAFAALAFVGWHAVRFYLAWASPASGAIELMFLLLVPAVPLAFAFPLQLLAGALGIQGTRRDGAPALAKRWVLINMGAVALELPGFSLVVFLVVTGALQPPTGEQVKAWFQQNVVLRMPVPAPPAPN